MEKIKRIIRFTTLLLIILSLVTSCATPTPGDEDDQNPQGLKFNVKDDGTYAVSIGEGTSLESITIPETYNDIPITEIAAGGFMNRDYQLGVPSTLKSITIPATVKRICANAFYACDNLTTVKIEGPSELAKIDANAFYGCTALTDVYYTNSVEKWLAISIAIGNNELSSARVYTIEEGEDGTSLAEYRLGKAAEYLDTLYKSQSEITGEDYDVVDRVSIDNVAYTVEWSVDVTEGVTLKPGNRFGFCTVDVIEYSMKDIPYTLTATITAPTGESVTKTYSRTVPYCGVMSYDEYIIADIGSTVIVAGVITAMTSKSAGSRRNDIFLQDADGGYYIYRFSADPAHLAIEVGMTVEIVGTKDVFAGTHEITNATIRHVRSYDITPTTPIDATDIVKTASAPNDRVLMSLQSTLITIKGVTITDQDMGSTSLYYKFTIDGLELYVRVHVNDCPVLDEAERAQIIDTHTNSSGKTADVTGIVMIFNGGIYLVPVSVDAFSNIR